MCVRVQHREMKGNCEVPCHTGASSVSLGPGMLRYQSLCRITMFQGSRCAQESQAGGRGVPGPADFQGCQDPGQRIRSSACLAGIPSRMPTTSL